ncbi:MAG: methyltransferase domain-containing protein [Phycisphaerales bacterium]|nr:methyltransferase domain-containing protein [Hyphomonadaceae bacterium]
MFDWRKVSSDPTNRQATLGLDGFLRSITRVEETSRLDMVLDFCRGQEVLDIGAGEHDVSFYSEDSWEHGRIARVAKRTVAAELMPELCKHYIAKGFDFRCVDATSDVDLGDRFDRVFIGDVIEHVNDPVALLNFAKRHLRPNGRILVTTPNPFAPRFRQHRRQRSTRYVMANLEHTRWVSISNMHEIVWRAELEMVALHWPLMKRPKQGLARAWAIFGKKLLVAVAPLEDVFAEYAFELAMPAEKRSAASVEAEAAGAE